MPSLHVDDHVRLTEDVPELSLHRGDVGTVCSIWFSPGDTYEVEFGEPGHTRRCLVSPDRVEPEQQQPPPRVDERENPKVAGETEH